jgi:glutathione synthase/RimK-type ligase-like ATP-grasp enzyme
MRRLGIMTHKLHDPARYDPYVVVGKEEGFDEIIIFTPEDVNLILRHLHGYTFLGGSWNWVRRPFPTISIDIGYYTRAEQIHTVSRVKVEKSLPFVGYGLGNKWTIQKHLAASPLISPFLLPTELVKSKETILTMVDQYHSVMIKPLNGKGGKGILRLSKKKDGFVLENPTLGVSASLPPSRFIRSLQLLLTSKNYIVQKWIDIRDRDGHVFDVRVLVQKNQHGSWQLTGMGIRQAAKDKITSNLTGGGSAHSVFPFLSKQFGEKKTEEMVKQLEKLSHHIPVHLENSYQKRLVELGLDLAIDRSEQIWVIEVNIKPGRTLWGKIGNKLADDYSLRAPVQYARYLVDTKSLGQ